MNAANFSLIKRRIFPTSHMDISSFTPPTESEREELAAEHVRAVVVNYTFLALSGSLGASCVAAILWNEVPNAYLVVWLLFIVGWNLYGLKWFAWKLENDAPTREWASLARKFELGGWVAGLAWGVGLAFFFGRVDLSYQAFIVAAMVMIAAGTLYGLSPTFRTVAAFLCTLLLPTALVSFMEGDLRHILFSSGIIVDLLICIRFAKANDVSSSVQQLLRLRNETLAGQLAQANRRLQEANIAKTRFLAAANHDLRQPMHAISLLVMALRSHPEVSQSAEIQNIVRKIQSSAEAMDALFNTVLDISKLDAAAVKPVIESFPLWNILQNLEVQYGPIAQQKGVELKIAKSRAIVRSDAALLDRIIRNFVTNAIRYTDKGRVLVGARRRGDYIEIDVIDNGVGIAAHQQEIIFQEFIQLDNPTHDRSRGLGLGLSIVQRLASLLEHKIGVISKQGHGSTFFVRIPIDISAAPSHAAAAPDFEMLEAVIKGTFIVVVDDEEDILYGMEALLKRYGCHFICASSTSKLLNELEGHQRQPDLIVTDFRISATETGFDVIRSIRESQCLDIPAMIVTGSSEDADIAMHSNFPVLRKPVTEMRLLAAMAETLSKNR
jgi:signal transduction histidine kinase/CheY-like chemotaxis protein